MKNIWVFILCSILVVASGSIGFVLGLSVGTGQTVGVVSQIANHSDAELVQQDNGDVVLYVPNKTESAGYQPILIRDNSTDTEVVNNTTSSGDLDAQLPSA